MDLDTRCRLSAKIIPWARDLENFISLFIIKLLNLNLTQSFSCRSRAGASCSAYWALLITGIRIHPALQLPSVGHPIQLLLLFFFFCHSWRKEMIDPGDPASRCFHMLVKSEFRRGDRDFCLPQNHRTVKARCNYRGRPKTKHSVRLVLHYPRHATRWHSWTSPLHFLSASFPHSSTHC